jgi:hypothetical protein
MGSNSMNATLWVIVGLLAVAAADSWWVRTSRARRLNIINGYRFPDAIRDVSKAATRISPRPISIACSPAYASTFVSCWVGVRSSRCPRRSLMSPGTNSFFSRAIIGTSASVASGASSIMFRPRRWVRRPKRRKESGARGTSHAVTSGSRGGRRISCRCCSRSTPSSASPTAFAIASTAYRGRPPVLAERATAAPTSAAAVVGEGPAAAVAVETAAAMGTAVVGTAAAEVEATAEAVAAAAADLTRLRKLRSASAPQIQRLAG